VAGRERPASLILKYRMTQGRPNGRPFDLKSGFSAVDTGVSAELRNQIHGFFYVIRVPSAQSAVVFSG